MRKGYLWDASLGPVHRTRARGFDFDWDRCIGRGQGALRVVHEASLRTSARHFFLFRSFFPCSSPSPLLLTLHAPPPSHFCPPSLLPHVPAPIPPHLRLSLSSTYRAPFPPFFPSNESSTLLPFCCLFPARFTAGTSSPAPLPPPAPPLPFRSSPPLASTPPTGLLFRPHLSSHLAHSTILALSPRPPIHSASSSPWGPAGFRPLFSGKLGCSIKRYRSIRFEL